MLQEFVPFLVRVASGVGGLGVLSVHVVLIDTVGTVWICVITVSKQLTVADTKHRHRKSRQCCHHSQAHGHCAAVRQDLHQVLRNVDITWQVE